MSPNKMTPHFSKSLPTSGLHFAAHSHHPWPDFSLEGQTKAWLDAGRLRDDKWDIVYGEVLPRVRADLAALVKLSKPDQIVEGTNTFELLTRVLSSFWRKIQQDSVRTCKILTTDSEFYSASRLFVGLEKSGMCRVTKVALEPLNTFRERFLAASSVGDFDVVFCSHVFFNSGFINPLEDSDWLKLSERMTVIIDGYHSVGAISVDLSKLEGHVFYLGGGYKYLMSGEGACFLIVPENTALLPSVSGWYAAMETLDLPWSDELHFPKSAQKFAGATFDPTPWYRMDSVFQFLKAENVTFEDFHNHARELQIQFADGLERKNPELAKGLIGFRDSSDWGNFLSYKTKNASQIKTALKKLGTYVDSRGDLLRFGFGCYQTPENVETLLNQLGPTPG